MTLMDLMVKISADSSGVESAVGKLEGVFGKIGTFAKVAAGATAAAVGAVGAGVVAMTTKAVEGYAEYEQLLGGVQKLYGNMGRSVEEYAADTGKSVESVKSEWQKLEDAQNLVLQNANNAYKTAGMSANQYMETATSFSAALISSLKGDTVAAAEQTDVAMRAISDNINTFGSNMEDVTNAFKGFSKQNYTMLDNLKLGYGGTKSEMERLIADANAYAKANGQAAELSIDSFSDIVTAIELVQEKQNVAGTTAREAATTIEGSINMTKMAWDNLIAGLGNKDADISGLVNNVVSSATQAAQNLAPIIEQALQGIVTMAAELAPKIAAELPKLTSELLPPLLSAVGSIVTGLAASLPTIASSLWSAVKDLASQIGPVIIGTLPKIIPAIQSAVTSMVSSLQGVLSGLINPTGETMGTGLIEGFASTLPTLLQQGTEAIGSLISGISTALPTLMSLGADIIVQFISGLSQALPQLISYAPQVITGFLQGLVQSIPMIADAAISMIQALAQGLAQNVTTLLNQALPLIMQLSAELRSKAGQLVDAGLEMILQLAQGLIAALPTIIETVPTIIDNIVNIINDNAPKLISTGLQLIVMLAQGLVQAIPVLVAELPKIIQCIWDTFTAFQWINLGKTIMTAFKSGIAAMQGSITSAATNIKEKIVGAIKELPARLKSLAQEAGRGIINQFTSINWGEVGMNVVRGIANGITSALHFVVDAARSAAQAAFSAAKSFLGIESPSRLMRDKVGKYVSLGMAAGIEDYQSAAVESMTDMSKAVSDAATLSIATDMNASAGAEQVGTMPAAATGSGAYYGGVTINVYAKENENLKELAERIGDILNDNVYRQRAVFA